MKRFILALAALCLGAPTLAASTYATDPVTGQTVPAQVVISAGGGTASQAQGNVASGTTDSGNPVKVGGVGGTSYPTAVTAGQRVNDWNTLNGAKVVAPAIGVALGDGGSGTGGYLIRADSAASSTPLYVYNGIFNGLTWDRLSTPNTYSRLPSAAATTNATSVKASVGWLFAVTVYNTTAAVKYLKLYNKASAPTVGTDTPVLTYAIPPNGQLAISRPFPDYFSTGIAYALTGGAADSDTTALAAGDVVGLNLEYR